MEPTLTLTMPKWRSEYGFFGGAIGYYSGKELAFTHRNPATGEYWCEELGEWINPDKVNFSQNHSL